MTLCMGWVISPVACSPVNCHQGGQYAHKEHHQHHVLTKCTVLSRWTPPAEEIFLIFKVSSVASEPSSSLWLIQILKVVVVNYPGINTELMCFWLISSRRKSSAKFSTKKGKLLRCCRRINFNCQFTKCTI